MDSFEKKMKDKLEIQFSQGWFFGMIEGTLDILYSLDLDKINALICLQKLPGLLRQKQ